MAGLCCNWARVLSYLLFWFMARVERKVSELRNHTFMFQLLTFLQQRASQALRRQRFAPGRWGLGGAECHCYSACCYNACGDVAMVRQVQVTVPHALVDRVVSLLRARDHVHAVGTEPAGLFLGRSPV